MTDTSRAGSPFRRGLYGLLAGGLLSVTASAMIALPASANPPQQCSTTVGQTASQSVQSYLDRHPDVKQELAAKSPAEGGSNNVLDYLNRHPDVRQQLIKLANKCTS
ncbi:heme-binding protein [Mycobacterium sp.]|uniref:heme-binding protein n=1 Tax=Mycobacterium sp. TaxID=1785 RepID=UPI003C762C17